MGVQVPGGVRAALAAGGGAAAACAFEPVGWAWLLPVAVATLSLACRGTRGRAAFGIGLLFGTTFMVGLLPWLRVIGSDAWLALGVMEGAFYGLLGLALARVAVLRWAPLWSAACWVAVEFLRGTLPWGGFPWGRLAFATVDTPLAPTMRYAGAAGTSFLVALAGCLLAEAVVRLQRARRAAAAAAAAGALAVVVAPLLLAQDASPGSAQTLQVAAVQGNVPGEGMAAFAERRAVLNNHVAATLALARRVERGQVARPDLVLWPENSTDIDPYQDPTVYADIQGAVDAVGVPVLVGAMVEGPGPHDVRNQGIVWEPGIGPTESYSKTHPVPFGEYIPMRAELAKLFKRLDQIPRDMVPGTRAGDLDVAGTTLGDVICFEVAYDGLIHRVVDQGAQLLVVQTNNATYMGTGQVEQQFAIARLRAIETDRYTVVVATNGVSGLIGPDGTVLSRAPVRQQAVLEHRLPLLSSLTPAVRMGPWPERGLVLVAALAVLGAVLRQRGIGWRRPGRDARRPAPTSDPVTTGGGAR